jgi:hypothetical protein
MAVEEENVVASARERDSCRAPGRSGPNHDGIVRKTHLEMLPSALATDGESRQPASMTCTNRVTSEEATCPLNSVPTLHAGPT